MVYLRFELDSSKTSLTCHFYNRSNIALFTLSLCTKLQMWNLQLLFHAWYKHILFFQVIGLLDVFHPSTSLDDFQQV